MLNIINHLKNTHKIFGIKAEFEAEGASLRDVMSQRYWTASVGLPLHLKIGGPEALRDIRDARDLNVDGIIAPMIESGFGVRKFKSAVHKIYGEKPTHLAINIETIQAVKNLPEILEECEDTIGGITIGRSDLCGSMSEKNLDPDHPRIMELVASVLEQAQGKGFILTLGGSLSPRTLKLLEDMPGILGPLDHLETRKVIFHSQKLVSNQDSLTTALEFERELILHQAEVLDGESNQRQERLSFLESRLPQKQE